ncbi:rifin [Plasmodium falciparum IGH-CR14]|uniref:Rifin n=1 Tax=Plasmodium falciparum IGH-CR14 TaxID=580059 RepID=A0A0L1I382_PLAFA|nr:rifin [Plasmodium falciparum IGH-CR14]
MKLHYTKILLFFFPLYILVTSYHVYSKNKPSITPHHTQTNRSLCECDTQSSNYDKDTGMKSVMQQFVDRTSQRFEEYEERMKEKRQKCKEQRDKNIQKIIHKDKMEKKLAEKIEKGCLRCGCGLGGVAASVGLFGGLGIYGWKTTATATATELAKEAVKDGAMAATIKAAGAEAFKSAVIEGIEKEFGVSILDSCLFGGSGPATDNSICTWVMTKQGAARVIQGNQFSTQETIKVAVKSIVTDAKTVAETAVKKATDEAIKNSTAAAESTYAGCQTAIIASVVAILVIVLVMMIIYLILRYRRKKKMKKKAEYTKLLNE